MTPTLATLFCGISSPNPFWLASGPPSNTAGQVRRAFEAGWGGVVWKTVTREEIVNVSSRYGAIRLGEQRVVGLNNIELISDRPAEENFAEIRQIKREFPDRAVVVSVLARSEQVAWHDIVRAAQDTGADGVELNFGCPHGLSERQMGSAVGQVPQYTEMITAWCREVAAVPIIVKLTPNVTDIREIGWAARRGGADAISLINTVNSIVGVDLDTLLPRPHVAGLGTHGGYCGPAVKPIALHLVAAVAGGDGIGLPVSGIGGIGSWAAAAEFMLLGAGCVQVCTAVMHHGFGIVQGMTAGLGEWMKAKGFAAPSDFIGRTLPRIVTFGRLDTSYKVVAHIDQARCVHCGTCYTACYDGCYQAIRREALTGEATIRADAANPAAGYAYQVDEQRCVGCNMCSLICPTPDCITMRSVGV